MRKLCYSRAWAITSLRGVCIAATAVIAAPALAQKPVQEAPGVISYTPDFFSQAQPQTALDMVQRVPGFAIASASSVRGYSGSAGNVLIDGKQPVTKTEALTDILSRIQASSVERIDLIRGSAPGIDMAGRAVVVNVIRRRAGGLKHNASANGWMFPDSRFLPGFRYDVSRQISKDRGFELTVDTNGTFTDAWGDARRVRRNSAGEVLQDVGLNIVGDGRNSNLRGNIKRPILGGTLQLNANISRGSFDDLQIIEAPSGRDQFSGEFTSTGGEVGLDYSRPLSDKLQGQLLVMQRLGKGVSSSAGRLNNGMTSDFDRREREGESIVRTRFTYRPSSVLEFETGAEGAFNFLQGETEYEENGQSIELPSAKARVEELRGEAFGQANWKPSSRFAVEIGSKLEFSRISLEGDQSTSKSFVYPKPRITLTWTPHADSQLRLRAEREVGQLSFGDFIASAQFSDDIVFAGNADLEPQTQWVLEAAAEQRFWGKGAVTLTLRQRQISNVLDYIAINEEFEAVGNIGSGTGREAIATFTAPLDRLALKGLTVRANATWRSSKVTDPLTGGSRRISGQRPFEGSMGFTHDVARWNLSYGFDANAGWQESYWRLREISRPSLTHWFRAFAEYKPTQAWSIRAEYVNLDEYRRTRTLFTGLREKSPVSVVESRVIPPPPRFNLRVRRTF